MGVISSFFGKVSLRWTGLLVIKRGSCSLSITSDCGPQTNILHVEDKTEFKATEFKLNAFRFNLVVLCQVYTKKRHHSPQEECLASGAKFKCLGLQSHPNRLPGRFPDVSRSRGRRRDRSPQRNLQGHQPCAPETEIRWVFIDMKDSDQIVL